MDLKTELADERIALREEIMSVGAILATHEKNQNELATLTGEYQSCKDLEEKAAIAMRVMDLRIAIDDEGFDADEIETRIDEAFDDYDNALMDALIAAEPQPPAPKPAPAPTPQISPVVITNGTQTFKQTPQPRSPFPPITNKCPLCDGYKRAPSSTTAATATCSAIPMSSTLALAGARSMSVMRCAARATTKSKPGFPSRID